MFKILAIDDEQHILDLIKINLNISGYEVETCHDGAEGLAKAKSGNFDAVIIDVMMPKLDGYTVCEQLRGYQNTKETPIILLTAKNALEDKVRGFDVGADDYLIKPFEPQELLVRLKALLRRSKKQVSPDKKITEILSAGDIKLFPDVLKANIKDKEINLTPIEFEILYCLVQHTDQPVKLSTILFEVWGYQGEENPDMLRVHFRHLRQKIEENPKQPKYLLTVMNVGYKLAVEPE
ncbi:MAG: response regulator transcription factor [Candidatus Sericytochromatia bacterium]|nr:response regulator transcription factor [Candidatus Sericytochromatia bacterium]